MIESQLRATYLAEVAKHKATPAFHMIATGKKSAVILPVTSQDLQGEERRYSPSRRRMRVQALLFRRIKDRSGGERLSKQKKNPEGNDLRLY
jgi:hypothetical protein